MTTLKEKLNKLSENLEANNLPVLKYLQKGLNREDIIKTFNDNGIFLNESLIQLYEWHNGVPFPDLPAKSGRFDLVPMIMFYSLDYMLLRRKDIQRWNYFNDINDFLPIFGSSEDDIYLVKNDESGIIYYLAPAIGIYGEYDMNSIETLIDYIYECQVEKVLTYSVDEEFQVNYEVWGNLGNKFKESFNN